MLTNMPSVCIPSTFPDVTWWKVRDIFEQVVGEKCVERVDMVNKINHRGNPYQCVFIHLKEWPSNDFATQMRERLVNGQNIKIVYDEPWFWKCTASRTPKPESRF
tara:strand:- start:1926 stop:2240 length:315 start_codon:yes stop_codon:yes gene_type:complete